jgi:hypothetical protein
MHMWARYQQQVPLKSAAKLKGLKDKVYLANDTVLEQADAAGMEGKVEEWTAIKAGIDAAVAQAQDTHNKSVVEYQLWVTAACGARLRLRRCPGGVGTVARCVCVPGSPQPGWWAAARPPVGNHLPTFR